MTHKIFFNEPDANLKAFITEEGASARLDVWLSKAMAPDFSRNRIKSLIENGMVLINGVDIREPKKKISGGLEIHVYLPEPVNAEPEPEHIVLDIVYEDDHLIVINKPAGLVVHPGAGNLNGTLVNGLLHHCGSSLSGIGGVKRPGIVHRLDKDTSGIMVVAKHDKAHRHLSEQFADHGKTGPLERAYLALVWGIANAQNGIINTYLGRSSDRFKRAVCLANVPDAKHAITHYSLRRKFALQDCPDTLASLVECRLETGRTHQIRVHMSHIGHPLIGDDTYGAAFRTKANKIPDQYRDLVKFFPRQALHACLLQFKHPISSEIMRFESNLPEDIKSLISALEQI